MFIWRGIIDLRRSITYSRCLRSQQHPLTVQGRKRARSKPPISRLPPSRPALSHSLVLSTLGQEKSNRSWIARQLLVPLQRRISRPQHSCTKAFTGRKGGPVSLLLWLISLPPLVQLSQAQHPKAPPRTMFADHFRPPSPLQNPLIERYSIAAQRITGFCSPAKLFRRPAGSAGSIHASWHLRTGTNASGRFERGADWAEIPRPLSSVLLVFLCLPRRPGCHRETPLPTRGISMLRPARFH
ncbi:hypothetical protein HDV57DRAFT_168981 [Trichoderma longibrachiatum]